MYCSAAAGHSDVTCHHDPMMDARMMNSISGFFKRMVDVFLFSIVNKQETRLFHEQITGPSQAGI
jgi:hypothetical protein